MNLYVVVEGARTEPALYRAWLPLLFAGATEAQTIEEAAAGDRHFYVVAGHGYPSWIRRLSAAAADLRDHEGAFQHLLICVDAEELAVGERLVEVEAAVQAAACPVPCHAIVADCCVETWLLGNRRLMPVRAEAPTSPGDTPDLRALQAWYDVRTLDPERMPAQPSKLKAATHLAYLNALFHHRFRTRYDKSQVGHAAEPGYLAELVARASDAGLVPPHLQSFGRLLTLPHRLGWA